MKVTIIGASPVIPNPNGACTGLLVQSGDTAVLIDCGTGVVSKLQERLDFHYLTAILITHMHSDHFMDLVPLRYGLKYAPWDGPRPYPQLFLPPRGQSMLRIIGNLMDEEGADFFEESFDITEFDGSQPLEFGPFRVTFAPTKHYIPCWAVRFEAEGRAVVFSADTGPGIDLTPLIQNADLFICEAAVPSRKTDPKTWGHLAPEEAGQLARDGCARQLVITHIWHGFDRAAMRAAAEEAFGGPTYLAEEGQVYEV